MADSFDFDLPALKCLFEHGLDPTLHSLNGCVPEVRVGSEILAAIRAGELGVVGGVVGGIVEPSQTLMQSETARLHLSNAEINGDCLALDGWLRGFIFGGIATALIIGLLLWLA